MTAVRSIRTWLAATLAVVSLVTAATIALYVIPTADNQFRSLAQDAALGLTARAAHDVGTARSRSEIQSALARASRDGQLSLWLVDDHGNQIAASALPSVHLKSLPDSQRAVSVALSGRRFVPDAGATASHVVALPARSRVGAREALVAYAPRAALAARTSAALRRRLVLGASLAVALALIVSLGVATLVTGRVRRLATAASAIASGDLTSPVRDGFPDEIGGLALSIDEMREHLAAAFAVLERERGSLSLVINRLEEGVIALDPMGLVEVVNPAASDLLGLTVERGRRLAHPWPAAMLERGLGDRGGSRELHVETPDGRFLYVQRAALRAGDELGPSLVVLSDHTEARHREAAEQRFMANASHELRTPLAAIVAAVEVLQSGAKNTASVRDAFLDDIQQEAQRLQRLTGRLLTLARMGSGTLQPNAQPVSLRPRLAHVAELMESLAVAGGVTLSVDGDAVALADPDILDQVLVGLVGNALNHTPVGGSVRLASVDRGDRVCVSVADSGSGIMQADLSRVFDRFWRGDGARRSGGFGLGLGICREYVEAMHGEIALRSEFGHGTTVDVILPRDLAPR